MIFNIMEQLFWPFIILFLVIFLSGLSLGSIYLTRAVKKYFLKISVLRQKRNQ